MADFNFLNPLKPTPGTIAGIGLTPTNPTTVTKDPVTGAVTGPGGSSPGGAGAIGDPQQALSALLGAYPSNPQQAIDIFNQQYPNSGLNPSVSQDNTIGLANGTYLVAPNSGGNNANTWQIVQRGAEGGGGGSASIDPSYLAPFTQKFVAPGDPNNPASAAGVLNPQQFTLPTEADLFASPGYQGAQDAARNSVVNSNASKGLINSGGNIYDLANVAAGLEGQQYGDLVNQKASAAGINSGLGQQAFNDAWTKYLNDQSTWYQNQSAPFSKIAQLANLGLSAAGNAG